MSKGKCLVPLIVCLAIAVANGAGWPQSGESVSAQAAFTPERMVSEFGRAVVLIAGMKDGGKTISLGSGFLVTPDGQVVTNYHVVRGAFPAVVKLTNGDIYDDISVVDYDPRRDVAVIKVKGFGLPTVRLGNSDEMKVGEKVVVIGNPQGLENSVSDGLLSGVRDSGRGYTMHQITAPISPGSSGSPVFSLRGEVIGVATSTLVDGQNLNFSVPVNYVRGLIGGPVQCALKDLPSETPPVTGDAALPVKSESDAFRRLIDGVTKFFQAEDALTKGLPRSHTAGSKYSFWSFDGTKHVKAKVDPLMYTSVELLKRAGADFSEAATTEGRVGRLAAVYERYTRDYTAGVQAIVDLFLEGPSDSWEARVDRQVTALDFCLADASRSGEEVLAVCKEILPELVVSLPPILRAGPPKAGDGRIGVGLPDGSPGMRVLGVSAGDPAGKAGIRAGDIIVGVTGGPTFEASDDFVLYIRPRAGQKISLRISRNGKERAVSVVPVPYRPD